MPTCVVLLRGVNVGKAKRVPMADFKQVLLASGCTRASTVLNSGNAVVEHPETPSASLARRIAAALEARFGFAVPVIVKSGAELGRVVAGNTLAVAAPEHPRLLVALAQHHEDIASLASLASVVTASERLHVAEHAAYLHCPAGILQSKAASALLGRPGQAVTTRNWATVLKLDALASQAAA